MGVYGTPLVKVLFRTPLLFTHRTLYRPNARGGPSSRFSQFLELCVVTRNFRSTSVTRLPECTRIRRLHGLRYFTHRLLGLGYLLSGRSRNGNSLGLLYFSHRLNVLGSYYLSPDLSNLRNRPITGICVIADLNDQTEIWYICVNARLLSNLRSLGLLIAEICDFLVAARSVKSAISWSPRGLSNLRSLRKSPGLRDRLRGTEGRCYPFHVHGPCCSSVFGVSLTGTKGKCHPLFVHRPLLFWSSRPTVPHGFTDGHQRLCR